MDKQNDCQICAGKNIIFPNGEKKIEEAFVEMRVRVGTLLKTDNVSFLLGSGTSIVAGGVLFSSFPKQIEMVLLKRGISKKGKRASGWLKLFYKTIQIITGTTIDIPNRYSQYTSIPPSAKIKAIGVNFETYLSRLYGWLECMTGDVVMLKLPDQNQVRINKKTLAKLIKEIVNTLTSVMNLALCKDGDTALRCSHRRFIRKILTRPLNLRRVNIFTLNYDTLIEQATDAEGAVLVDGFVGSLQRVFRPESYDLDFYFPAQTTEGRVHRFDRAIHLYKLHGSINWHKCDQSWENPYGLYAALYNANCSQDDTLIYPTPLKYGQVLGVPYSEMFRRFGNAIAQSQSVLFVIGYGFGDDHVNSLIRQSLAVPSVTIVVVDPTPKSEFLKQLESLGDERVWVIKGQEAGAFEKFVENVLPDLKDEEIEWKVVQTFQKLDPKATNKLEDSNGK
jgi:hypothetical protein